MVFTINEPMEEAENIEDWRILEKERHLWDLASLPPPSKNQLASCTVSVHTQLAQCLLARIS